MTEPTASGVPARPGAVAPRRTDRPSVAFGLVFLAIALWAGLDRLGLTLVGVRWAVPVVLVTAGLALLLGLRRR